MKRKSHIYSLLFGTLFSFCLLTGCNSEADSSSNTTETTSQIETDSTIQTETQSQEESITAETTTLEKADTIETLSIDIQIINMCGVEIGTFSVIDPVTGNQINLDSIADQEMLTIEAEWPVDTEEFQWALYNQAGELCLEGTSNISGVTSRAILLLTGDGNVENVEVTIE